MIIRLLLLSMVLSSCATKTYLGDEREIAQELVKITSEDSNKAAKVTMKTAMSPLVQSLKDQGYEAATILEVNYAIDEYINNFLSDPTLNSQIVDLYVGEFSLDELQAILDFYQLPVGKKTLKKLPAIMQKSADIGFILGQKHHGAFAEKIDEILLKNSCEKCEE